MRHVTHRLSLVAGRLRHYFWFARFRGKNELANSLIRLFNFYVMVRARLSSDGIVHVVGDSHTRSFRYQYPIVVHHLGGATAHNLVAESSTTDSRFKLLRIIGKINLVSDRVLLVFGEIDCRLHIYRSFQDQSPQCDMQSIVDATIKRYFSVVGEIKSSGCKLVVCGVPPAAHDVSNRGFPVRGPLEARIEIARLFNGALERESSNCGVDFLDIHSFTVDAEGLTLDRFSRDGVHLNRNAGKSAMRMFHTIRQIRQ